MADWDTVREAAAGLPAVEESTTSGRPALRVGGRLFAWMSPNKEAVGALAVRVDPEEKPLLIASRPDRLFSTPHYEGYPILLVRLDRITPEELAELVEDAWLLRAPRRLVDEHVGERPSR
jgi:hypothetical protein